MERVRADHRADDGARRPRIADVAQEAGVSKTAVSFAFNAPERLAAETTTRILRVAADLGYTPHPVARMLTQRQTLTIGVLTPQALSVTFSNPSFGAFSAGVAAAAERHGFGLHFISPLHGSLVDAMQRATVDGVVAIGLSASHPELAQIRRAGLPVVLVDSAALPEHGSVDIDDERGAQAAARHLVELGHRDAIVLAVEPPMPGGPDPDGVVARRLRGYRAAFAGVGIHIGDDRVLIGPANVDGGTAMAHRALDRGHRPTAVLAMSDAMAIGAMAALRHRGTAVPRDVSVVGFDDIDMAAHVDPPLTTIRQPMRRKGEEAVEMLLGVVARHAAREPEHRHLATRLIVRGSTGPVPVGPRTAGRDRGRRSSGPRS